MSFFKTIFTKLQIGLLAGSSLVTSVTVLLIIYFLFSQGLLFFTKSPIEESYSLYVHKNNPIPELQPEEIKKIFDQEILSWSELQGLTDSILLITLDDLAIYYNEDDLGSEFEHAGYYFNDYIAKNPGTIAVIPTHMIDSTATEIKLMHVANNSLTQFLFGKEWFPTSTPVAQFGVLAMILGTILVSIGAIGIALPLGLSCAIYMSEIMHPRYRNWLKPVIELLAGIPSVVYGFFGLVIIVPLIQKVFNLDVGETALAGSIILGIMALPTIITISEDALMNVPNAQREASLALGATKWQTIYSVVLPYAKNGIITASVLGIGRAVGETMAVLMVTGNAANIPTSFLQPVRTIPATIAAELGEAPYAGVHFQALFALACILFLITMSINIYVSRISKIKV